MKKISRLAAFLVLAASFSTPLLAFAQNVYCPNGTVVFDSSQCPGSASGSGVNQKWAVYYKDFIVGTVNTILVPILMAIAFIVFLWGVYKYFIQGAADEKSRTDGRQFVLWAVIGFVVITSVWGVVNMVKDTLIPSDATTTRPNYPTL